MSTEKTKLCAQAVAPSAAELAKKLGRRLRYLRAQNNVTQAELSSRATMGRAYLSRLERGKILPRYLTLVRLAACLGVDPVELVRETRTSSRAITKSPNSRMSLNRRICEPESSSESRFYGIL